MRTLRSLPLGLTALALALVAPACSPAQAAGPTVTVYHSPTCGCCGLWVDHLRANGFQVEVVERSNLAPVREQLGVPWALGSCHTAVVDGYAVEGHVPADVIHRLLRERPPVLGIAVPGMPLGSPGMEQLGRWEPYEVFTFDANGPREVYEVRGGAPAP